MVTSCNPENMQLAPATAILKVARDLMGAPSWQVHSPLRPLRSRVVYQTRGLSNMLPFTKLISRLIPMPVNNIDTDKIIPARYLKVIDKNGLADGLFYSWRYHPDGSPNRDFCLNQPAYRDCTILVV